MPADLNVSALRRTGLLDAPPEAFFDRLTTLVTRVLKVPVSIVSLVDEERQFFISSCGLPQGTEERRETPLTHSFCQHVVINDAALIVADAREHPVVRDNLAIPDLGVIAYAGMPLRDEEGTCLGALCAIDGRPREWTSDELATLQALADQCSSEIVLRNLARRLGHDVAMMQAAEEHRHRMARLDRHDLRTPLQALRLSLGAIGYSGPITPEQDECIAAARRNCDAIIRIVDHMLDLSTIDHRGEGALRRETCRPAELIDAAIGQVASLAVHHRLTVELGQEAALPGVSVDREKMVRVLVNLLGNALKFTPAGGQVSAAAQVARNAEGHPEVLFTISDNGPGMPPDRLTHIFHEGVYLDDGASSLRSTGLGLTFCQRVVEAHSGRIWVQSRPGEGASFSFALPGV